MADQAAQGHEAMTTSPMTARQRVLTLLRGRRPDRIPTDYWATAEFDARIKAELGCSDDEALWRKLHIDAPLRLAPRHLCEHHPDDPLADAWGVRTKRVEYGTGTYYEVDHCPLAQARSVQDVHAFRWPSADDYDYTVITDALAADDGTRPVRAGIYEPFLIYCSMRGMEQSYEDLLLNPGIADAILGHLFEFHHEWNRRIFDAGCIDGQQRIDITYVAEDLGSQTGPLISLDLYRRFLRDNQRRMEDLARSHGIHVFYHTDGAAYLFINDLIDVVGIEVLNPIQWRCPGMEREKLVREFGSRIVFHGGMDNQQTLPFGTADDVVNEVKRNIEIFSSARWICAPCHNIQAVTPTRNVVAMYDCIEEIGGL